MKRELSKKELKNTNGGSISENDAVVLPNIAARGTMRSPIGVVLVEPAVINNRCISTVVEGCAAKSTQGTKIARVIEVKEAKR